MLLWIAMAVLAAAAALSILVPLYRSGRSGRSTAAQEMSIYRDQLGEIDRDLDRGLIAESEATAARTEIARRLIHAAREEVPAAPEGEGRRKLAAIAGIIAVPALAVGLYLYLGSPDMPDLPLAARLSGPPEAQDVAVLVARVESHLATNPDDGAGWEVIAPVYMRLGRYDDAVKATQNAVRLLGSTTTREGNLGEAIVVANDGTVTEEARAAFARAAALDPKAVRPRFYLAIGLAQSGRTGEARTALEGLAAEAPPDAPWLPRVRQLLAELGAPPAPGSATAGSPAPPGPSTADVEAAAALSPEERNAMIAGMVTQLAERLQAQPDDAAGWARLVRSYMVLGRKPEAEAALARARTALAADPAKLAMVEAEAKASGLTE